MISTVKKIHKLDLKLANILVQHVAVIFIGIGIFYIDKLEFVDSFYPKVILLLIAFAKSIYFLGHSFKKIEEASVNNISYSKFLIIILVNILLIIVSFTVDYACLDQIDNNSFIGVIDRDHLFNTFYDFFYFSITTFSTVGAGDIFPATKSSKFLVILEVMVAFITTIIVISNFVQIKDSIEKDGPVSEDQKEDKREKKEILTGPVLKKDKSAV